MLPYPPKQQPSSEKSSDTADLCNNVWGLETWPVGKYILMKKFDYHAIGPLGTVSTVLDLKRHGIAPL